ncbi:MAG: hypothetical protein IJB59_07180 [Oscillospiraceae bacterium]|nr:hypothetical protein [Oscillospiraceae bacterium]
MTINYSSRTIQMTKKFAKAAEKFGSDEYKNLQEARRDNPTFKVVIVARKAAEKKDNYKGLTYSYMEKYINAHDDAEEKMKEYKNLRGLSDEAKEALAEPCSYNEIRAWFLNAYPAIAKFHEDRAKLLAA